MQRQGVGSALALVGVLCLTSISTAVDAKEEELKHIVANADPVEGHQQGDDRSPVETRHPPAPPVLAANEEGAQNGEYDGPRGENPRLRGSGRQEGAAGEKHLDAQFGASPKERQPPAKSDKRTKEDRGMPWKAEGGNPAVGARPKSAPPTFQGSEKLSSPESSTFRDPTETPVDEEGRRKWHVYTDTQAAVPLFGDLQQFALPRFGPTPFSGFTGRPSPLGGNEAAKPREADDSSPSQNLFDFPGSTTPLFPVDISKAIEAAGVPLIHWFPVTGADWRLPGWPDLGSQGRLKNVTIGLPGLGNLGGLPFGMLAEIPTFPAPPDLLQDPLNIDQLKTLFREALTQVQESPPNVKQLKETVEKIVRLVTPQESFLVKQIVRAHKERDATRARGLAEAILEAAGRVGQQLQVLKEVSVGGTMGPGGDFGASGPRFMVLGDVKEVLDVEEAFTNFRRALEQLLAPLVSVLPAFSPSNWAIPSWA